MTCWRIYHGVWKVRGIDKAWTFDKASTVKLEDAVETAEGCADRDACRMSVFVGDLKPGVIKGQFSGRAYQFCASVEIAEPFFAENRKRVKVGNFTCKVDFKGCRIEQSNFSESRFSFG